MEIWVTYEQSFKNINALHMSLQVLIGRYHFIHLPLPSYYPALLLPLPLPQNFSIKLSSPLPSLCCHKCAGDLLTHNR